MRTPVYPVGDFVDPACPLEWGHPLNAGLTGEWSVLPNPGWRGGVLLRDITRGGHSPKDGTLTNIAFPPTSISGWAGPKGRPGGFGAVRYDGFDDQTVFTLAGAGSVSALTIVSWYYPTSTIAGLEGIVVTRTNSAVGLITSSATGNPLTWLWNGDGNDYGAATGLSLRLNEWNFCGAAIQAGGTLVFLGNSAGWRTYSTAAANSVPKNLNGSWSIGRDPPSGGLSTGIIDGTMLYVGRALTNADARALYAESRAGNPNRWRWVRPRAWVTVAAGGNVSVALTGQAAAVSAGTLAPATAVGLSGSAVTASPGAVAPALAMTISGTAATAAAGTLSPATSVGLSGIGVTGSAGSLTPGIAVALSGVTVLVSAGTVTPAGDVTVALTGQAVTVSAGSLVPGTAVAPSGVAVTVSAGSLSPALAVTITGAVVTCSAGTLTATGGNSVVIKIAAGPFTITDRTATLVVTDRTATFTVTD